MMKRQKRLVVILLIFMFLGTAVELFLGAGDLRLIVIAWGFSLYLISRQAFSRRISLCITISYILISCVSYCVVRSGIADFGQRNGSFK